MSERVVNTPTHLFEVSWEVCNKVGGIHTVIATKAYTTKERLGDNYFVIGPDFGKENDTEFIEDPSLYKEWKKAVQAEGLKIRIGRWKIEGEPIAILVSFSDYLPNKDEILTKLWTYFGVDSLSAQWDYIEPVLFGYAAARCIQSYYQYHDMADSKVVAHFHEWMTASGVLVLRRSIPAISTLFTTHATVMGRCIAGNGLALYNDIANHDVDELAKRFNVTPKHTIEKFAALNCDCFATVSTITSSECKHMLGKCADIVTPNGFENKIVYPTQQLEQEREASRAQLLNVAQVLLGKKYDKEPLIVGTCGRYEYRNKGIDTFIDALASLKDSQSMERDVLAFILVPGWNCGARRDLQNYIENGEYVREYDVDNVTHYMGDKFGDQVLNKLQEVGLYNNSSSRVNIIFVPAYLNGNDGIFNRSYYQILTGLDVTAFASYYEPWGYTPLESIAFSVPTITTSLAGFGRWINDLVPGSKGVDVIERDDYNYASVTSEIAKEIKYFANCTQIQHQKQRDAAKDLASVALWSNLIEHYYSAYDMAIKQNQILQSNLKRDSDNINNVKSNQQKIKFVRQQQFNSTPTWRRIMIERTLPERLHPLEELSKNLWWSWTLGARELFERIDERMWVDCGRNPITLLDQLSSERIEELLNDHSFLALMDDVYGAFQQYMGDKQHAQAPKVAYFSMEYGLHNSLKIYSGGLGILAGDYLKEASDQNIPMVAIGLLYRYGYFAQRISSAGEQEAGYDAQNFYKLPISPVRDEDGNWKLVTINMPGREVQARIWRCDVGRTELYLLDTDFDENLAEDRYITHHLYGGDWENRLKQEIVLGIGGVKALEVLGVESDVYHCNEGHAAFMGIRRTETIINQQGLTFAEALEVVRSSSLYTTHTPVPAGHDAFSEDMMRQYFGSMPEKLKISWEQFIGLGRVNPNDHNERFSMSFLACHLSQEVNGVSWLHGEVSKDILSPMWPGYFKEELNVGYVTNGVHYPTWTSSRLRKMYSKAFGSEFDNPKHDKSCWQGIYNISDEELWDARLALKRRLINYIKRNISDPLKSITRSPMQMVKVRESLNSEKLTIGFARRFATYKRAHLLFTNLDRLDRIVNNPTRPVQFLFAGKAHPNDKPGQDLIKRIVEVSKMPQFEGKILFLQNYDMDLARRMVQGVDVWLNTPTRPLEASGTSGEKAVMNGVLHFSVLDGWWVEGYQEGAGWALAQEKTFEDDRLQNELDAELVYSIIEEQIAPAYYAKNELTGVSSQWVGFIKKSIADVASNFTTKRMIEDYQERFYEPLHKRAHEVKADNYEMARKISEWKYRVASLWNDNVHVEDVKTYNISKSAILTGNTYKSEVVVNLGELSTEDVGVEVVIVRPSIDNGTENIDVVAYQELNLVSQEGSRAHYELEMTPKVTGIFDVAVRLYARNPLLTNRMEFSYVKWS